MRLPQTHRMDTMRCCEWHLCDRSDSEQLSSTCMQLLWSTAQTINDMQVSNSNMKQREQNSVTLSVVQIYNLLQQQK